MDGLYVSNFGMGIHDMKYIKSVSNKPVECHLMIQEPLRYIELFVGQTPECYDYKKYLEAHRTFEERLGAFCGSSEIAIMEDMKIKITTANPNNFKITTRKELEKFQSMVDGGYYETCSNYSYLGSREDGAFSEYVTVPKWNIIELNDDVSYEHAALLEPAAVALHAVKKLINLKNYESCCYW